MSRDHQPDEDDTLDEYQRGGLNVGFAEVGEAKGGEGEGVAPFGH